MKSIAIPRIDLEIFFLEGFWLDCSCSCSCGSGCWICFSWRSKSKERLKAIFGNSGVSYSRFLSCISQNDVIHHIDNLLPKVCLEILVLKRLSIVVSDLGYSVGMCQEGNMVELWSFGREERGGVGGCSR